MHMEQIRKYGSVGIEHAKFYEFGAGWDLIGPLAFYIMGARDQTLVGYSSEPEAIVNQPLLSTLPQIGRRNKRNYRRDDYSAAAVNHQRSRNSIIRNGIHRCRPGRTFFSARTV